MAEPLKPHTAPDVRNSCSTSTSLKAGAVFLCTLMVPSPELHLGCL